MAINWQKGFNRLWLFLSIALGIVMALIVVNDGDSEVAPFVAIVYFGATFVVGHIVFKVVLWIIKGFRDMR